MEVFFSKALARALRRNTTLIKLNLINNGVGDEGARALAYGLKENNSLRELDLQNNGIKSDGGDFLETVKKLGWAPDLVHCHGWFSSMIPLYLRTTYKDNPSYAWLVDFNYGYAYNRIFHPE